MNNLIILEEYRYLKEISKTVPELIKTLDKYHKILYAHKDIPEIANILDITQESKIILEGLLEVYQIKLNGVKLNE